jgi:hypothetical protein
VFDTIEKWRNVKLATSLLRTNILLTVSIMSCELVKGRILFTRGKGLVEYVAKMRERCVHVLVGIPEAQRLLVRPMCR